MGRIFRRNPDNKCGRRGDKGGGTNWDAIPEVRLIGEDGNVIGIVPTDEALDIAKKAGLELINISPNSVPPVCKIYDYGKYNYEQQKKQKNQNNNKANKFKEIQFSIGIECHDLDIKLRKIVNFLQDKCVVQLVIKLKKRDMARLDVAMERMREICKRLEKYVKRIDGPKLTGKKIVALCR